VTLDVLPDSRLKDPNQGAVMADFTLPSGQTVRLQMSPVFCANCGADGGYVPTENMTFAFYICQKCHDSCGAIAGTLAVPDEEFRRTVAYEMEERFGKALTAEEIHLAVETGRLGTALDALLRESPYRG
jgi:hypothetical protein